MEWLRRRSLHSLLWTAGRHPRCRGLERSGNGIWDGCNVDQCVTTFGQPDDLPVAGDWDATGTSKIGLFRAATGDWFLDFNGNGQWDGCGVDKCVTSFGQEGDLPVAGK